MDLTGTFCCMSSSLRSCTFSAASRRSCCISWALTICCWRSSRFSFCSEASEEKYSDELVKASRGTMATVWNG